MTSNGLICVALVLAQPAPRVMETSITLTAGKDAVRAVLVRPAGTGPFPAVLVLHGDFGLTTWVKQQARHLAEKGYVALAVDLYNGELPKTVEDAHILDRGLEERRVLAQLRIAVDHLARHPDVRRDALGVVGWDMGGGYALDAALADRRLRAVVLCYGRVTTDPQRLGALNGPVLALFGGKDEGIPAETLAQFRKAMQAAGKTAHLHVYPQCGSNFMDPDSPYAEGAVDRAAIADAWRRIEAHLAETLRRKR